MPTRLGGIRPRYFDTKGGQVRRASAAQTQAEQVVSQDKFGGYAPDVPPQDATLLDFAESIGLVYMSDALQPDLGYAQVDSGNLPLGEAGGTATIEPVVGLMRFNSTSGTEQIALTADAVGPGHLYELVAGTWTEHAYDTAPGPSGGISGTVADLFDWAYLPALDRVVFCNGPSNDNVMMWPFDATVANEYTDFNQTEGSRVESNNGGANVNFKAQSVVSAEDRLIFLNTHEGGTNFPRRVRWTTKGGSADFTGTGQGLIDLGELDQGIAIRRLANLIICYFNDGVAVLERTLLATDAFRRQYVSHLRGVVGTHAVAELGFGLHFGIYNDGWYTFNAAGEWNEVGVRDERGKKNFKWKDTFYNQLLNVDNQARVVVDFDQRTRLIRIAFPSGASTAPSDVWVYNPDQDTVWPDLYTGNLPNIWGKLDIATAETTWDDVTDSWDATTGSWRSFRTETTPHQTAFGTVGGRVLRMDPALTTRDGDLHSWSLQTHLLDTGAPQVNKTNQKLYARYRRIENAAGEAPDAITATVTNENSTSVVGSIPQNKGTALGIYHTGIANLLLTGSQHRYTLSGTAPTVLTDIQAGISLDGTETSGD